MLVAHNLHICNANIGVIEQGYFQISRAWRVSMCIDNYGRYCVPSDGVVNCFPNSFTRFLMAYEISGEVTLSHPSICYMLPLCRWARAVVSNRQALDWVGSLHSHTFHLHISAAALSGVPPVSLVCLPALIQTPIKACLFTQLYACLQSRTVCVVVSVELVLFQTLLFTPRAGWYYQ